MDDLVERLLARKVFNSPSGARLCKTYNNPDGPEAAAEITRLQAENEELRSRQRTPLRELTNGHAIYCAALPPEYGECNCDRQALEKDSATHS